MKEFLKCIGSLLSTYPKISLTRSEEIIIRNETIKYLGLTNLNQLRDRFEGQAFYDKTLKNVGSVIAIQKFLELPKLDILNIHIGEYLPVLKINEKEYQVEVFKFGELPLIDLNNLKDSCTLR